MIGAEIVVVGGGIAGQALVEALRARDPEVTIALVCDEPELPYDRVRLSELLISGDPAAGLRLRPDEWYEDAGVEVIRGRAAWGRPDRKLIGLHDGTLVGYDRLALPTGSSPLMPPIEGIDLDGVHPFRDPADCEAIREAAATARHAAVIGGGLLGLEAARGIAAQGCAVTVVHLMDRLMERQLDEGAARMLAPAIAGLGVVVEGVVAPIRERAGRAAATLLGEDAAYEGSVMSAKLKVAGIDLVAIGEPAAELEAVASDSAPRVYRKR